MSVTSSATSRLLQTQIENIYLEAMAFVYPSIMRVGNSSTLEAMAIASIERVMTSDKTKQELIERGRLQIQKFSSDRCAEQTASIYDALSRGN